MTTSELKSKLSKVRKAREYYVKQQILLKESGLPHDDFWNIVFSDSNIEDEVKGLEIEYCEDCKKMPNGCKKHWELVHK